jgi:hypothetical protein
VNLNSIMELDHVVRVGPDGTVTDAVGVHAPSVYVDTDEDGQILGAHEQEMIESVKCQGWELLSGWTGQYCYHGPIMHPSEFVGGRLAKHILETPGLYCAVSVETNDNDELPAGWAVAFKECE